MQNMSFDRKYVLPHVYSVCIFRLFMKPNVLCNYKPWISHYMGRLNWEHCHGLLSLYLIACVYV